MTHESVAAPGCQSQSRGAIAGFQFVPKSARPALAQSPIYAQGFSTVWSPRHRRRAGHKLRNKTNFKHGRLQRWLVLSCGPFRRSIPVFQIKGFIPARSQAGAVLDFGGTK